jgi:drug/metabolite transporter (DMT)-like permease
VIAIVGGLATAMFWAVSVLVSARASRLIGASSTVAGAMAIGLAIGLPIALALAPRPDFGGDALLWMALSGFGNVLGLLLTYAAYRIGAVGIVSTIDSTEGAVAAVISVLAGEVLVPGSGGVLAVIAVGVVLAASAGGSEEGVPISRDRATRAAALAVVSAVFFAIGLYGSARAAVVLPVAWAILPPRVVGVLFVAVPLVVLRRFRMSRAALPFVAATGVAEVIGYWCFAFAARESIALASVLSSMFAPIAAVAAYVVFRERLSRRQVIGIALVVCGVAALGLLQA